MLPARPLRHQVQLGSHSATLSTPSKKQQHLPGPPTHGREDCSALSKKPTTSVVCHSHAVVDLDLLAVHVQGVVVVLDLPLELVVHCTAGSSGRGGSPQSLPTKSMAVRCMAPGAGRVPASAALHVASHPGTGAISPGHTAWHAQRSAGLVERVRSRWQRGAPVS